jgi:GAF domain-containing protein
MVGAADGGRILVVVPESVDIPREGVDVGDWDGSRQGAVDGGETGFGHDDDCDPVESGGSRADEDGDGNCDTDRDSEQGTSRDRDADANANGDANREPSVETVLKTLERHLRADVVVRCRRTYAEYVEELGPTLDCVVVLGKDESLVRALVEDSLVPTVIYSPPIVGTIDGVRSGDDGIETLLNRVESAVQEDRHINKLRESNARLAALSHYAEDIAACKTAGAVAEQTIEATTEALAFDHAIVFLAECGRLVPQASALPDPAASATDLEDGIAGRTLATGESEVVADMQSDPDAVSEHDDLHAVLSVPVGDQGVIQAVSDERDAFDDRDVEFLEILAGYTAEALERIEREVTLRRERDRLHAFFDEIPASALYVERNRPSQTLRIEETNGAYDDRFGTVESDTPLTAVTSSDAETEQYEAAMGTGGVSNGRVERTMADGSTATFALSVVSVSLPDGRTGAYGIYIDPTNSAFSELLD